MSEQRINWYKADLRDIKFCLFEQFKLGELLGKGPYAEWGEEEVNMVIDEFYKFVCDKLGSVNTVGDKEECQLVDGKVKTPSGFKEAWDALLETGFQAVSVEEELGGQGAPFALHGIIEEMMSGSNLSFGMYVGLAHGAADVIGEFGTEEQRNLYAKRMVPGEWGGTMCLTEPQAGSDVGACATKATKRDDGKYDIEGTKYFITGGDHDLTDTIVHLVLARTPDAPPGTKGLSLFIVPRDKVTAAGKVGENNDVLIGSIEHKMGIKGSSTCTINFGESGNCVGELVGTEECQGIKQMFKMMNAARIGVGLQGLGLAAAAYQNAVAYCKERKQGPHITKWKDPTAPKVPIIQHADVRRMLLDMKARVEGIRALAIKLSVHTDRAKVAKAEGDEQAAAYHEGQVDLLVPLVKAYGTDQGFLVCATAIQAYGGAGYCSDNPVEQYCRDAKIGSIFEGTNHIQAMDLVGRKLAQKGGANFQAFAADVNKFIAANRKHRRLQKEVAALGGALEALSATAMRFLTWFQGGQMEMVPLSANRFQEMMSETAVSWLLLDAAVIAYDKAKDLADDHPDKIFARGKAAAAAYFVHNVLPNVKTGAAVLGSGDQSALTIKEEEFTTI